jgi:hypothetical protein
MILEFHETFTEFGLELAIDKSEVMLQKAPTNTNSIAPNILVNGHPLKVVNHFKYLGSQLQGDAGNSAEIAWRIKQSAATFSKMYQRLWPWKKKAHFTENKNKGIQDHDYLYALWLRVLELQQKRSQKAEWSPVQTAKIHLWKKME